MSWIVKCTKHGLHTVAQEAHTIACAKLVKTGPNGTRQCGQALQIIGKTRGEKQ
jgi:hypothetical protein